MLALFFLVTLAALSEAGHKKIVIHVPLKVKKLKHTHTIYKTIHHFDHHHHGHHHHHKRHNHGHYYHHDSHPHHHDYGHEEEHEHFHHYGDLHGFHSNPVPVKLRPTSHIKTRGPSV